MFLEVVGHICSPEEFATNLAGDLVLMACQVGSQSVSRGKGGITDLERKKGTRKLVFNRFFDMHCKTHCTKHRSFRQ